MSTCRNEDTYICLSYIALSFLLHAYLYSLSDCCSCKHETLGNSWMFVVPAIWGEWGWDQESSYRLVGNCLFFLILKMNKKGVPWALNNSLVSNIIHLFMTFSIMAAWVETQVWNWLQRPQKRTAPMCSYLRPTGTVNIYTLWLLFGEISVCELVSSAVALNCHHNDSPCELHTIHAQIKFCCQCVHINLFVFLSTGSCLWNSKIRNWNLCHGCDETRAHHEVCDSRCHGGYYCNLWSCCCCGHHTGHLLNTLHTVQVSPSLHLLLIFVSYFCQIK